MPPENIRSNEVLTVDIFQLKVGLLYVQAPEEVMNEARSSLPAESECTGPQACRIRIRLPDGSHIMRPFLKNAPLAQLHAFVLASSLDAASGRSFNLFQAGPGE